VRDRETIIGRRAGGRYRGLPPKRGGSIPRSPQGDVTGRDGHILEPAGAGGRQKGEAAAIHAQLLERWRSGKIGAYYLAFVPTASGDYDAAFSWLDRSVDDGSLKSFPSRFKDPPFDDLARDDRLDALRRRIGLRSD